MGVCYCFVMHQCTNKQMLGLNPSLRPVTVPSKRWWQKPSLEGPVQLSLKWGGSDYDRKTVMESAKRRPYGDVTFLSNESGSELVKIDFK